MSSKKIAPKHSLTTDEQIKSPPKIETPEPIQKSNTENLEQPKKEKTPKPEELKNFDAIIVLLVNIVYAMNVVF